MIYIVTCYSALPNTVCSHTAVPSEADFPLSPSRSVLQLAQMLTQLDIRCQILAVTDASAPPETAKQPMLPICSVCSLSQLHDFLKQPHGNDYFVLMDLFPSSLQQLLFQSDLSKNIHYIINLSGKLSHASLRCAPFLVRQTCRQLEAFFQVYLAETDAAIFYARRLQACGARNVLLSLEDQSAILLTEDGELLRAPAVHAGTTPIKHRGCSCISGFLMGWLSRQNYHTALECAVCAPPSAGATQSPMSRKSIYDLISKYRAEGAVF